MGNVSSVIRQGRSHTRQVAQEIVDRWPIYWIWINGPTGHHAAGRAIDFMTLTDNQSALRTSIGDEIAAYVQKNAERLGAEYVIWRQRIWNATRSDDRARTSWSQWRRVADRGSPTANHMDTCTFRCSISRRRTGRRPAAAHRPKSHHRKRTGSIWLHATT